MRQRIVRISPEVILEGLATGAEHRPLKVLEGVPAGSTLAGAGTCPNGDVFLLVNHEDFEDVLEVSDRPTIQIVVRREDVPR